MGITTAAGLWIPRGLISPGQLAPTVAAGLPALVQQRVPVFVHRLTRPEVTFMITSLDGLGDFHPYSTKPNLMDPLASALAKMLGIRVFSLFAMAGSVECLRVASFDELGAPEWAEMLESEEPFARMAKVLELPRRQYVAFGGKHPLEPRGGGWNLVGEVRIFQLDPGDAAPELLRTGDYVLFDPLAPVPPPFSPKKEKKAPASKKKTPAKKGKKKRTR